MVGHLFPLPKTTSLIIEFGAVVAGRAGVMHPWKGHVAVCCLLT